MSKIKNVLIIILFLLTSFFGLQAEDEPNSEVADLYYQLGVRAFESGDFEKAAGKLEKAVKNDSNHAEAYYQLGLTCEKLGRPGQVLGAYRQCLSILARRDSLSSNQKKIKKIVAQAVKNLDTVSGDLEELKKKYAARLTELANKYRERDLTRFAELAIKRSLVFDPENKTTRETAVKMGMLVGGIGFDPESFFAGKVKSSSKNKIGLVYPFSKRPIKESTDWVAQRRNAQINILGRDGGINYVGSVSRVYWHKAVFNAKKKLTLRLDFPDPEKEILTHFGGLVFLTDPEKKNGYVVIFTLQLQSGPRAPKQQFGIIWAVEAFKIKERDDSRDPIQVFEEKLFSVSFDDQPVTIVLQGKSIKVTSGRTKVFSFSTAKYLKSPVVNVGLASTRWEGLSYIDLSLNGTLSEQWVADMEKSGPTTETLANILREPITISREAERLLADGFTAIKQGNPRGATEIFNRVADLEPDFPDVYNANGAAYIQLNDFDRALEEFTKAIKLNPEYFEAYRNRASVWMLRKKYKEAISDCSRAIALAGPGGASFDLYSLRGLSYYQMRDFEKALPDLERSRELGDKNPGLPGLIRDCKRRSSPRRRR